ncbi:2-dehydro-3,6-dideoxy-6-sulfogluconate aldolase [Paraburkholderia aspalathi]|uniref:HpcH/HpaI aldolase family protein n=1 Tax=Paraburkholderia aspalathi TaxID=1324617 RepID=UPI0019093E26|nr:aldolase/citrate lyase family protein [Paraburkholderia aspalathi]MBK3843703.1 2-dehydro-3-deoxyglucarate aldolase [Paraburkholderia aspalathi]CAE6858846.1 2-dehydro-3,6-dideoxy-6-sulfogluconate aldolase [Paraburkholderia aspalathi]CAE6866631.1 2-dehydro-3,6-dideoxy-6-sulfogluconate aldolase [Paraburkholderia aspalathi]
MTKKTTQDFVRNAFRDALNAPAGSSGQRAKPLGVWLMSGSSATAEALGYAGFDWLLIDMEHVPMEFTDVEHHLRAVDCGGAAPIVRLAKTDATLAKRALDMGATTIMFPFVQTPDEARAAVASTKFPPLGTRGFAAMHRASRYGTWSDFGRCANDATVCIVQLETPEAVAQLEEIAAVPGVDALFVGPGDLSAAMGKIGNLADPEVRAAIADCGRRANAIGKPIGIIAPTPAMAREFMEWGFDYVAIASDLSMMMRQANAYLAEVRNDAPAANAGGPY